MNASHLTRDHRERGVCVSPRLFVSDSAILKGGFSLYFGKVNIKLFQHELVASPTMFFAPEIAEFVCRKSSWLGRGCKKWLSLRLLADFGSEIACVQQRGP